ncbi:probable LRR receptor-like serine/threonine-protein kinase At1g14390 [Prosopis cineraria]|uniref:probable LRR receptor-like serine/threonine-protein kinase At1g14390 n=1 Tax=Prosopis cineraria TaxID=364024 RepID=UPI00240EB049|nr:probable LRR receptor-like serine/threonine-protein kinase At1g14390 [Prosopis cineraria]
MKIFRVFFLYLLSAIFLVLLTHISTAQLTPSESRILFQVQKILEYPQVLQGWNKWTNFCYLPSSPSLQIVCYNSHVIELTIVGNKTSNSLQTLSERFSIDSFFTVLTKLSNLKVLSIVSLGLWGPLPAKISRFWSLQVLNLSSNSIHGEIPPSISSMKSLRSLVLDDNLFNGTVPDLKRLTSLEELNLGNNKLGLEFPSLGNSLVSLVLRNNSLSSKIPSEFNHFDKLQKLDISSNEVSGNIPSSLFSLHSIQYLNLAENKLSGSLSMKISCGSSLTFVDISNNLLVGNLPSCIGSTSKSSNRTALYSGNCLSMRGSKDQHPTSYCKKEEALAAKPLEGNKWNSDMRIGLILGIIGGSVGISALLALVILLILRKTKAERIDNHVDRSVADKSSVHASLRPNTDTRRVPQTMRLVAIGLQPYRIFTLEEIEEATNNFDPSNLIGEGSEGQQYKGWIRDGSVVLINCVKLMHNNVTQNHIDVLSNLRHRHLVSVIGHCLIASQDHQQTATTLFLVYEHFSNGSLRDHLTDWRKKEVLKWPQRMAITIGIARGIQFLHTGIVPGIFGNKIKIEKILLDDSLGAKVSGYNIPLLFNHIDSTDNTAEKEDIYQFGVILLEVITGKSISSVNEVEELKDELERSISEAASVLRGVTDPTIRGSYAYDSMRTTVQITISCLSEVSSMRPSIEDVLWNLQYAIQVQENWSSSGNLGLGTRF